MSKFMLGNIFLFLSMVLTSASQIVLKGLVDQAPPVQFSSDWIRAAATPATLARGTLAVAMMAAGFCCWLLCLTRLNLSYAYPIACTSVFMVTLLSVYFLNEVMTARMWAGTALIALGIILLIPAD